MKLALALIVALQVSVCLCEIPDPPQELEDKYEQLKATFLQRLKIAIVKAKAVIEPMLGESQYASMAKEYIDQAQTDERFQTAAKVAGGVAGELRPAVDAARKSALGVYGHYLRPYIGEMLDEIINNVKPVLDAYMPAE